MNLAEHLLKMRELAEKAAGEAALQIRVPAANALRGSILNRISVGGKASDGRSIGQYSTKAAYYTKKKFVKKGAFKPTGKKESAEYATINIKTKKANLPKRNTAIVSGKKIFIKTQTGFHYEERQAMYLPGGYKELRSIQGFTIGQVNLSYSGDLLLDYQQTVSAKETLIGFTKEKQSLIRQGLEGKGKFNKNIFKATTEEIENYNKECAAGYAGLTLKILGR